MVHFLQVAQKNGDDIVWKGNLFLFRAFFLQEAHREVEYVSFQIVVLGFTVCRWFKKKWRLRKFCRYASKVHDEEGEVDREEKEFIQREREKPTLGDFTLGEYTEKVVVYGFLMVGHLSRGRGRGREGEKEIERE